MPSFENYISKKIGPATGYFGAKAHLARRIVNLFPEHKTYVEPFAGAMNVLLNKYRSPIEVVSDLNPELIHFYTTLVNYTDTLLDAIARIPYCRESFTWAKDTRIEKTPIERAVSYLTIQRMIWSGVGSTWMDDPKRRDAWERLELRLVPVANRLRSVTLIHGDALDVIQEYDSPATLFYTDPPYFPSTRVSPKAYTVEMKAFDHLRLLKILQGCRGSVVLSGYDSIHYNESLSGWEKQEIEVAASSGPTASGQKKTRRVEILWIKHSRFL